MIRRNQNPVDSVVRAFAAGTLGCSLLLCGCAAAVPIVSAASTGAAAGEAGFSFWQSGKLTYVDEGTTDQMNRAMATTIDRLDLTVHKAQTRVNDDDQLRSRWWSLRSDRGHLVTVEVRPLTDALVEVKINAGPFGNRAAAELIADRMKNELDAIQETPDGPSRS